MLEYNLRETVPGGRLGQQRGKLYVHNYLYELQNVLDQIPSGQVAQLVELIIEAGARGQMIFICGNGGSASTASHMACDLGKGARMPGFPSFRAIALTDSLPQLTAWANDTSYDNCFAGQLEGLGRPGDLLIAISGSGNSPNVLKAVEVAKELGMITLGLAGFKGGKLGQMVDHALVVPAPTIEQVEDAHLILEHTICTTIRRLLAERLEALEPEEVSQAQAS
jgi:D-sedoheptulose 7-phosphate isomerase